MAIDGAGLVKSLYNGGADTLFLGPENRLSTWYRSTGLSLEAHGLGCGVSDGCVRTAGSSRVKKREARRVHHWQRAVTSPTSALYCTLHRHYGIVYCTAVPDEGGALLCTLVPAVAVGEFLVVANVQRAQQGPPAQARCCTRARPACRSVCRPRAKVVAGGLSGAHSVPPPPIHAGRERGEHVGVRRPDGSPTPTVL